MAQLAAIGLSAVTYSTVNTLGVLSVLYNQHKKCFLGRHSKLQTTYILQDCDSAK